MTKDPLSGFASAFDAMLDKNRRQLDALGSGLRLHDSRRAPSAGPSVIRAPAPARAAGLPRDPYGAHAGPNIDPRTSSAGEALTEKLGPGWRYEVVERVRSNDEVIVRCRVSEPGLGVSRTVFGATAKAGGGARLSGSSGSVPFGLGGQASGVDADRALEAKAVESAFAACLRLL